MTSNATLAKAVMQNPKILHRIFFDDMPPYRDPFEEFLGTWRLQMPDYRIMRWNRSNLDLKANEWVERAVAENAPVFLSEYFRWWVLGTYGGIYLDADCEILDGRKLHAIAEDMFSSKEYEAATGVEEYANGHPTAQTVIAQTDSEIVHFMLDMYNRVLSSPLWHWREQRGLIGPQLMSLYFIEHGWSDTKGMFTHLATPTIAGRVKVYPQDYFSPKYAIDGTTINYSENTCVYHLFANLNMHWDDETKERLRSKPMLFADYVRFLKEQPKGPERKPVTAPRASEAITVPERGSDKGIAHAQLSFPTSPRISGNVSQKAGGRKGLPRLSAPHLVPSRVQSVKTLHRIYFGFDGRPDELQGYLATWRKELPNYEIRHWNAENLPVDLNAYTRELAAAHDHAFLTDYFRWWVLKEHGGVYLDADVEVVDGYKFDKLVEELAAAENYDSLIGIDEKSAGWYTAHTMASKPGSCLATTMCQVYEELGPIRAWRKKAFYLWAPQLTALYFFLNGHNLDGMGTTPNLLDAIVVAGVRIYPQDYFSPIAPLTGEGERPFTINALTYRTSLCHHFACSWHEQTSPFATHATAFRQGQNPLLQEIVDRQISGSGKQRLGIGARLPYSADHPALSTDIGNRTQNGLEFNGTRSGTGLYGPYIDLPPGRYLARILFAAGAPLRGYAVFDVACHGGALRLAETNIIDADVIEGCVELPFAAPEGLKQCEVRIFCEKDFVATVERIEIEAI